MATSLSGLGRQNAYEAVAASDSDEEIIAAQAGKKIRVHSVIINHGDTTASSVTFGSGGTVCYVPLKGPANGGFVMGDNPSGWFETVAGESLTVDTGAGSTTSIAVTYSLVS